MRKSGSKRFRSVLVPVLFLISAISVLGQEQTQVYQGCTTADEYFYPGNKTFINNNRNGEWELLSIDRAQTSDSRFLFTFRPNSGGIIHGENIIFTAFMFGMDDKSYFVPNPSPYPNQPAEEFRLNSPAPLSRLNLKRYSQIPADDGALLNWNEDFLTSITQSGEWYVIYQKEEDFNLPTNVERYIVPLRPEQLPTGNAPVAVDARLFPQNFLYRNNEVVYRSPQDAPPPLKKSYVKKLSALEFDTDDLEIGRYWFTLQRNTTVGGQTCPKTTPPVMIEIKRREVNYAPKVKIDIHGKECEQKTITVYASDDNNRPGDPLNPQTITLSWTITNKLTGVVVKSNRVTFTSAEYSTNISTADIPLGNYAIEVKAKDGFAEYDVDGVFANTDLDIKCRGAGIVYFQFDEPFESTTRLIKFDPAYYTDPESWVAFNDRVKVKNQCKLSEGRYPGSEFPLFYSLLSLTPPPIYEDTNTRALGRIIAELKNNNEYDLFIYGYADFRNSPDYNRSLVNRRLQVVQEYLERNGITRDRLKSLTVDNFSDLRAQNCNPLACDEPRRHDRRVELFYYVNLEPKPPVYPPSPCPENALIPNSAIFEWETGE